MNKRLVKILSVALSFAMVVTCLSPINALAEFKTEYPVNIVDDTLLSQTQKDILSDAIEKWNEVFIQKNKKITNATDNDLHDYLIVKTIYDFIIRNTAYDIDAYNESLTTGSRDDFVGTAYSAFFGNIEDSENASDLTDIDYDFNTYDNGNQIEVADYNQGKSVCEGYTSLFYLLCESNDIQCTIVEGTKTSLNTDNEKVADNHSWNFVKMHNDDTMSDEWYQVDTTYASESSIKKVGYIDYDYFLRGSDNIRFTLNDKREHQNIYQDKGYPALSSADCNFANYNIALADYKQSDYDYVSVIMKSAENADEYTNSLLLKNDNSLWKYELDKTGTPIKDANGERKLITASNIDYSESNKYVYLQIPGYIYNAEYKVSFGDSNMFEPGEHTITATSIRTGLNGSSSSISFKYIINKIDMSIVDENNIDISINNNDSKDATVEIPYGSVAPNIVVSVSDKFNKTVASKEYDIIYIDVNSQSSNNNSSTLFPTEPGEYIIQINFAKSSRYTGIIQNAAKLKFIITKYNISSIQPNDATSLLYNGSDQITDAVQLSLNNKVFINGIDYKIEYENQNHPVNAGTGRYRLVALDSSKYLSGATKYGSITVYQKSISAADISFYYSNLTDNSANVAMSYNGVSLVEGVDYAKSITSTSEKTTLTVKGIGNYTGTRIVEQGKTVTTVVNVSQQAPTNTVVSVTAPTPTQTIVYPKPKSTSIKKLSTGKKQFKVTWKKLSGVTGYEICYSTSKKFTKNTTKTVTVKGAKSSSKTIKKLKGKKKYYVKIRVYSKYKMPSGAIKTVRSSWSKTKTVTTKK